MELESETLFAGTWDNVEAILKRILIILSETFDKNTDFEAVSEKKQRLGRSFSSIVVLTDFSWLFLIVTNIDQCPTELSDIMSKPNLSKYEN